MQDITRPTNPFMLLLVGTHAGGKVYENTLPILTLFGFNTQEEAHDFVARIPGYSDVFFINGRKQHIV